MRACPLTVLVACAPVALVEVHASREDRAEALAALDHAASLGLPVEAGPGPVRLDVDPTLDVPGRTTREGRCRVRVEVASAGGLAVVHELGHALDLDHRDEPGALMEPVGPRGEDLTDDEIDRAHARGEELAACP